MQKIIIYSDGSSKGNPGAGGFGAVIFAHKRVKEIGGMEGNTTNNRMEMRAATQALQGVEEGSQIEVYSDSEYLIKGISKWIFNWQKNNWRNAAKKPVLNRELWEELYDLVQELKPRWTYVKGHNEDKYNDRADLIATSFAEGDPVELKK